MSPRHPDRPNPDLEALYRDAGDAEPPPGLDRIVRARADDAIEADSRSSYRPWLGGLVAASVAVVAVSVVLQRTPPAPEAANEAASALEQSEPSRLERENRDAADLADAPSTPTQARNALQITAEPKVEAQSEAAPTADAGMRERQEAIDDPPIEALAAEEAFSPRIRDAGEMLESIRELIDAGRIERARAQLEALERIHPEVEVPAEILKALESQSP